MIIITKNMKIHTLSKLLNLPIETIRMYRNKGLLHPAKKDTYYDYSIEDAVSLLHLRKLRSFDFSIQEIHEIPIQTKQNIMNTYQDKQQKLIQRYEQLCIELRQIQLEIDHLQQCEYLSQISIFESYDTKIDIPFPLDHWSMPEGLAHSSTISLNIDQHILNGPIIDQTIPLQVSIGFYQHHLHHSNIQWPSTTLFIEKGECIGQIIKLSSLQQLNIYDLQPMMQYAKDHDYIFVSPSTAYLITIEYDQIPYYVFRIRALVQKKGL